MKKKVFKTVEISTEFEQYIRICPTNEYDGIEMTYKEAGDIEYFPTLYLDRDTMESLIITLQEMMTYIGK